MQKLKERGVPRTYHANLKCVSKRWRDLVRGEEWRIIRKKYNLEETWIYALCSEKSEEDGEAKYCCYVLDPYNSKTYWKRIQDLPPCIVRRQYMMFEVLGQKAYLIGGCDFTEIEWSDIDVPNEDSNDVPNEDSDDVPNEDSNDVPNEDSDDVPDEDSDDVPDEDSNDVPNEDLNDNLSDEDSVYTMLQIVDKKVADEVHCYDAMTNTWCKAAPLSTPRCSFASGVLDGKIYAIGSQLNPHGRYTWETYDPTSNIWTAKSDRHTIFQSIGTIVYNGKLYVQGDVIGACGGVYDPSVGIWNYPSDDLVADWHGLFVVADGKLFSFDHAPKFELRMWDEDRKEWMIVSDMWYLWEKNPRAFYRLVAIGSFIFFIGRGLFTAVLDVTNVGKPGWKPLISYVTHPIPDITPVSCKCMTI